MSKAGAWTACCILLLLGQTRCGGPAASNEAGEASDVKSGGVQSGYAITDYEIDAALDPDAHSLEAKTTFTVRVHSVESRPPAKVRLRLHPGLKIGSIRAGKKSVAFRRIALSGTAEATLSAATTQPASSSDADCAAMAGPAVYELDLKAARPTKITVEYSGRVVQDIAAGEKAGEIHNKSMNAHIGPEGVYLSPGGDWYPRIAAVDCESATDRQTMLASFILRVANRPGLELVASGNRERAKPGEQAAETTAWRTPFPMEGMCLVGGKHGVHERMVGGVSVRVHLSEEHAQMAEGILDAVERYLKLYEPLLGNYPYRGFTVVENFFSSGFAFPGFTVLSSRVIAMGAQGLRHGYLDHELLHNWWGNGVFVSELDGNWCEALTTYCTNYMRSALEGRPEEARRWRRNACHAVSWASREDDQPLDMFGRPSGPDRLIGYSKGAMVFSMLADRVGEKTLWMSLKALRLERCGRPTTWDDIECVIEKVSGRTLDSFFKCWVRKGGLPKICVDEASYDPKAMRLTVTTLQQGGGLFDVALPIRLVYAEGKVQDEVVFVKQPAQAATIRSLSAPSHVLVDPDYRVLRKLPASQIMPTISRLDASKPLAVVRAEGDAETYGELVDAVLHRRGEGPVATIDADDAASERVGSGHVLFLGRACLTPAAGELLENQAITFGEGCFTLGETRYAEPGQAVLFCMHHPADDGAIVCFYWGNSDAAVARARTVPYYGHNNVVVWENSRPTHREDRETPERIDVVMADDAE